MGIRTMIVSGDRAPVVESVGRELGIDETYSHYSPLEKADLVESLVAQGKKVCAGCKREIVGCASWWVLL